MNQRCKSVHVGSLLVVAKAKSKVAHLKVEQ